jgi:hypothetical protein
MLSPSCMLCASPDIDAAAPPVRWSWSGPTAVIDRPAVASLPCASAMILARALKAARASSMASLSAFLRVSGAGSIARLATPIDAWSLPSNSETLSRCCSQVPEPW